MKKLNISFKNRTKKKLEVVKMKKRIMTLVLGLSLILPSQVEALGYRDLYNPNPKSEEVVLSELGKGNHDITHHMESADSKPDFVIAYIEGTYLHSMYKTELLWRYTVNDKLNNKVRQKVEFHDDDSVIKHYKDIVEIIIPNNASDKKKVEIINDFIVSNMTYYDSETEQDSENRSPRSLLVHKRGVCQTYASAFQIMAEMSGLESVYVTGDVAEENAYHAWNMVKINGKWLLVDTTWNSTSGVKDRYLMLDESYWMKRRPIKKEMLEKMLKRAKALDRARGGKLGSNL